MKNSIFAATALLALTSSPAMAAFVVDTGTPENGELNFILDPSQSLAGFFTLGAATTVTAVEGYINSAAGNGLTITLYSNGAVPAAANAQFTAFFLTAATQVQGAWQGFFGLNWELAAGNYWLGFASTGSDGMFTGAPNPLSNYAYTSEGNWFEQPTNQTLGIRVTGVAGIGGAVPEPASWAMMIAGFGLVGGMMRRRVAKVSYA